MMARALKSRNEAVGEKQGLQEVLIEEKFGFEAARRERREEMEGERNGTDEELTWTRSTASFSKSRTT